MTRIVKNKYMSTRQLHIQQPKPRDRFQPATWQTLTRLANERASIADARKALAEVAINEEYARAEAFYLNLLAIYGGHQ